MRRRTGLWIAAGAALLVLAALVLFWTGPGSARRSAGNVQNPPAAGDATWSGEPSAGAPESQSPAPSSSRSNKPGSGSFAHPGVLLSRGQLDFIRSKVQDGAQPWKSAFDQLRGSQYASLSRTARPRATVECGSYSNPDNGCSDERTDALAAYTDALVWYVTRDTRYAAKAIELLDAWSATLKTHTNSNAPLQTGWAGAGWSRAAELIASTYSGGWPNAGRFATLLRTVYLPVLINGSGANGNWELIMTDALMGISVFLEDRASFTKAVALWRGRVPAYIYLKSDGPQPLSPPTRKKTGTGLIGYW